MKNGYGLLGLLTLVGSLGQAETAKLVLPTYKSNTCIIDANDPYEPNVKMDHGPLKGLCVNPLSRRSVKILSDDEAKKYFSLRDGYVVVANFSHHEKFWVAQIPVQEAQTLKMQIQYFPVVKFPKIDIAHTQFLFEFKEGAEISLKPQVADLKNQAQESVKIKKMIFTVENIGPYGEAFHALPGRQGHYNLAYRVVSLEDKYNWMIAKQNHVVSQKLLKLTPQQVRSVLAEALSRGNRWSTSREYNTIKPNCVSELFSILDQVLNIKGFITPFLPNVAPVALWSRGILDTETQLPTLNEEYDGQP